MEFTIGLGSSAISIDVERERLGYPNGVGYLEGGREGGRERERGREGGGGREGGRGWERGREKMINNSLLILSHVVTILHYTPYMYLYCVPE